MPRSTLSATPPARWRTLRIGDATMSRTNYLYALPPQKLSSAAMAVRDELKRVVRRLVEEGEWQGVGLTRGVGKAMWCRRVAGWWRPERVFLSLSRVRERAGVRSVAGSTRLLPLAVAPTSSR